MEMNLNATLTVGYKSNSQKMRILSESWAAQYAFCPNCGNNLEKHKAGLPVADFFCQTCDTDFELKAFCSNLETNIVDGAYKTMLDRLASNRNPNLFLLQYSKPDLSIQNFLVVPKYFFTPNIIEKRKPLSPNARRAGWVGCNIQMAKIPSSGKVFFIKNRRMVPKQDVIQAWLRTCFLSSINQEMRGWLLSTMKCIEMINNREFSLEDMYRFEKTLQESHPNNHHIREKIRQQLQVLRDKGYLVFLGDGKYRLC